MASVIIIVQAVSTAFFFIPAGVDAGRLPTRQICEGIFGWLKPVDWKAGEPAWGNSGLRWTPASQGRG